MMQKISKVASMRVGVVQASQEASAKRQAQIKEARVKTFCILHSAAFDLLPFLLWVKTKSRFETWNFVAILQGTQSLEKEQLQLASKLRQLEGGRPVLQWTGSDANMFWQRLFPCSLGFPIRLAVKDSIVGKWGESRNERLAVILEFIIWFQRPLYCSV